jgi:hypothetical protein
MVDIRPDIAHEIQSDDSQIPFDSSKNVLPLIQDMSAMEKEELDHAGVRSEKILQNSEIRIGIALNLFFIATFWTIILLPIIFKIKKTKIEEEERKILEIAKQKFVKFIGADVQYGDAEIVRSNTSSSLVNVSGMAYADGRIYVLEEGVAAEIPWLNIRAREWRVDGAAQTRIYGRVDVGSAIWADVDNLIARKQAESRSGFIIKTKDIEKSEWKFQTSNENILKKWMEILAQMQEGRIKAR